ncbi:MAG TPA: inorganic diphosphatase [Marmoricola sp.]|nr:inorganic diphosphatase [Marmoricola sp.]
MHVEAVVEVPQGHRNKYEVDHTTGRMRLDRMLFTSTRYPADYGFLEDTLGLDGDPLDVLILLDEPTFPGCLVTVRPVALFDMSDENGSDEKVLAVPAHDPRCAAVRDLGDLDRFQLDEIMHFFQVYKELEPGKGTTTGGWRDRAAAELVIVDAVERARVPR